MSRSLGALSFTTSPPIRNSPAVMSSSPAIMRSAVDFPQPDGPTRIMNSPSAMSRSIAFTASKPSGYRLVIALNWISAIPVSPLARSPPTPLEPVPVGAAYRRCPVMSVARSGMPVAGPRRQYEQQPRVTLRAHGGALVRVEHGGEPGSARERPAPVVVDLDVAFDHDQVRP